jgi:CO/xanthine dehydrogenase Mo-binding subunit
MTGGAVKAACEAVRGRGPAPRRACRRERLLAGGKLVAATRSSPTWPTCSATTRSRRPSSGGTADHPLDPETGQGDAHVQYAFAAHRAVVDVDVELGLVKVVELATAQDVGKA